MNPNAPETTDRNSTATEPPARKRTLAEIIAAVELAARDETAAEPVTAIGTVLNPGTASSVRVPRTGRAKAGTRRFKGVMVEIEPSMLTEIDAVAERLRVSRSALIRDAVQRVWLKKAPPRIGAGATE